jgi:1-phosphofructokinase/tagatose 6-phosphate kinase
MKNPRFISVSMNPTFQKTLVLPGFAPDTVIRAGSSRLDIAGKGLNVCRVLTQLGKDCVHLTQLGGKMRPLYLDLAAADNISLEWVESGSPIRFCYTLLDPAGGHVTELVEEGEAAQKGTEGRLLEALGRLLPGRDALIISGSKAAGFSASLVPGMVRIAKDEGLRVYLDLRGPDLLNSLEYKPFLIKPNLFEFVSTFAPEFPFKDEKPLDEKAAKEKAGELCRELYRKYGCLIVLTRGALSVWYSGGGELEEYKVDKLEPVNTVGSGDAFTAGIAAALESGVSLGDAIAQGARCGALNAGLLKPGSIK